MAASRPQQAYLYDEEDDYGYYYDDYEDYGDFELNTKGGDGQKGINKTSQSSKMTKRRGKRGGSNTSGNVYSSKHLRAYESLREKRGISKKK